MILTVEPGFYIQADDTLFSPEYRGIGIVTGKQIGRAHV